MVRLVSLTSFPKTSEKEKKKRAEGVVAKWIPFDCQVVLIWNSDFFFVSGIKEKNRTPRKLQLGITKTRYIKTRAIVPSKF